MKATVTLRYCRICDTVTEEETCRHGDPAGRPQSTTPIEEIAWICENGHVDQGHYMAGNYLDRCSRRNCDGICTPRPLHLDRRKGAKPASAGRVQIPGTVTVLETGGGPQEKDAADFKREPYRPFALTPEERAALLSTEEKPPRITFPTDEPLPIEVGEIYEVAPRLTLVALGFTRELEAVVLKYEVRDERDAGHLLGSQSGYSDEGDGVLKVTVPPSEDNDFVREREPEAVERPYQRHLSEEAAMVGNRRRTLDRRVLEAENQLARDRKRGRPTKLAEERVDRRRRQLREHEGAEAAHAVIADRERQEIGISEKPSDRAA